MDTAIFDYEEFYRLIETFALDVPALLMKHTSTAPLATQLHGLLDSVETSFTVAVVGQMRSGKSSLLNALVGEDLAVTGVNETTATINWFMYGEREQCNRFRVIWKDRPPEEQPLSEIQKWIGDSERAKATRYLEFYAPAEFLRRANVVDTPGTRSVLDDHTEKLEDFLAARLDAETRRQGCAADAILYVLMPVARQSDRDLLTDFEKNTRLPGSSPYNSMAVVHKWETLNVSDPRGEAQNKADQISKTVGELVSVVLPVSAPLARAAEQFSDAFWSQVLTLAQDSTDSALKTLLLQDTYFLREKIPGCPLSGVERQTLRTSFPLPWPSLKTILNIGRSEQAQTAAGFRASILKASGIVDLRNELQRRFFARSRMIKAFSVLSKALEPCQVANIRLRNHKVRYTRLVESAQYAIRDLASRGTECDPAWDTVRNYVNETRTIVEEDLQQASDVLRRLGDAVVRLHDGFEDMNADLRMLEKLEEHQGELEGEWFRILRSLFGYGGPDVSTRIAPLIGREDSLTPIEAVLHAIGQLRSMTFSAKRDTRDIFDHAIIRLEQVVDLLETQARAISRNDRGSS